jgi:hypothetical protein
MAAAGVSAGWRALAAFWLIVVLAAAGGVGWLAWLGPLPAADTPAQAEAPAVAADAPARPDAAAPPDAPAGTPGAAVSAPGATAAASPPAPPPPSATAPPNAAPHAPPHAPPAGTPADAPDAARPGAAEAGRAVESRPIPVADPDLLEPGPHGPLPRIGPQGRSPIRTYGRPFDRQDPRPRVGLIIGGLGLNAALTEEAIRRLPPAIGLAFSPYAPKVELLLDQARARGMEILLALPLEPTGYPLNNPGNRALLTSLSETENQDRLDWAMARFGGYVGAIGAHGPMRGERFALLPDRLSALQRTLAARGLLYVDPRPNAAQPARAWGRAVDLVVDEPATRGEIERKLDALERLARERGTALGYAGEPSPVLVDRIAVWGGAIEARGVVLAPITALIRAPSEAAAPAPPTAQARGAPTRGN